MYFGFENDPVKPQIFRSEWPGIRDWAGAGPTFQSPGAGHPHWQFDLRAAVRGTIGQTRVSEFKEVDAEFVEDFGVETAEPNVLLLLQYATIERMHFASAAPWWLKVTNGQPPLHMNAPEDVESLSRWLFSCISYLKQELARCEISVR